MRNVWSRVVPRYLSVESALDVVVLHTPWSFSSRSDLTVPARIMLSRVGLPCASSDFSASGRIWVCEVGFYCVRWVVDVTFYLERMTV
ncbi:hypothetical protein BHE74_00048459 [Ensete ventricosum]|nr:hypothetical protein BHE74_00048459 [Ensete ventricosum]